MVKTMIPIIVKGSGLIPRGHGIAPKLDPFNADQLLVGLILQTPGLVPYFADPDVKQRKIELTNANYLSTFEKFVKRQQAKSTEEVVERKEPEPVHRPINPFLVVKLPNGTYKSTGIKYEEVLNGTKKGESGWLIHKGGNEYETLPSKYVEVKPVTSVPTEDNTAPTVPSSHKLPDDEKPCEFSDQEKAECNSALGLGEKQDSFSMKPRGNNEGNHQKKKNK